MAALTVFIGNKNYSSWSLRGWLVAKLSGQAFEEVMIPLDRPETASTILRASPSGRIPALRHGDISVWDSLAMAEYLSETFPAARMWPSERHARAIARSITAEMHSGFASLRQNMTMNIRRRAPGIGRSAPGVQEDITRIVDLWTRTREQFAAGGEFLFGHEFLIPDAFYAPVVTRFQTYGVEVPPSAQRYMQSVLAHPFMKEWVNVAMVEPMRIEKYEV